MTHLAEPVRFETPQSYLLDGLLFGDTKSADIGYIFLHGLTANMFSLQNVLAPLTGAKTVALYFNNRGHDKIAKIRKLDPETEKGYTSELIGEAMEVFTDCVDDIQGAIDFLEERGISKIILVGHSTGCQKSVYYLSGSDASTSVIGAVLLCPLSDYAAALALSDLEILRDAVAVAEDLIARGTPFALLPDELGVGLYSAQRFLSLNTPDSTEEIFTYAQPEKTPTTLQSVRVPMLAVFAENDEYSDRPAEQLERWFVSVKKSQKLKTAIISGAVHNLSGYEAAVSKVVQSFTKEYLTR